MSVVPVMDLRESDPRDVPSVPHNLDAEQGVLGALLYDNECFNSLPEGFGQAHFYEPFHGRLFRSIAADVRLGLTADPIMIAETLSRDQAFKDLGGVQYLADLVDRAPATRRAVDYAKTIMDLAARRELMRVGAELIAQARDTFSDDDTDRIDAKAIADAAQRALTGVQLDTAAEPMTTISAALAGVVAYIDNPTIRGASIGLPAFDKAMGPMMPGDLIVLGGRPGMGKSAVAQQFSVGVAAPAIAQLMAGPQPFGVPVPTPAGVIDIHGEMSFGNAHEGGQVAFRLMANLGFATYGERFPEYRAIRERRIDPAQREMMLELARSTATVPYVGRKRTLLPLAQLRSLVRRQAAEWDRAGIPLGLVVIDHAGLLKDDGKSRGRYEEQTNIAIGLKALADELRCPVLALVQLSRDLERRDDKRPIPSDLRDSGAWEECADAIVFVYRDSHYAKQEKEPDPHKGDGSAYALWSERCKSPWIELSLAKLRAGDAGRTVKVWGDLAHNAIRPMAPQDIGRMT